MPDDVSVAELQKAVEHMHGVPARFVGSVEVNERQEGKPVWSGAVKVFELTGHPSGAKCAYAWSYVTTAQSAALWPFWAAAHRRAGHGRTGLDSAGPASEAELIDYVERAWSL
jgi:hypothetical protein